MFQFSGFAPLRVTILQLAGLPHSEICGSPRMCQSPQLIAAYHVFHRLQDPRHPPYALCNFLKYYSVQVNCSLLVTRLLLNLVNTLVLFSLPKMSKNFILITSRSLYCLFCVEQASGANSKSLSLEVKTCCFYLCICNQWRITESNR